MRISVIIPCYNAERFVERAVLSALAQERVEVELVLVNDGSTDGTVEVLERLKLLHPERITVVDQVNRGACAARNAGMAASNGTYLQFLDADDVLRPTKLERHLALAEAYQADLVIGSSLTRDPAGTVVRTDVQGTGVHDDWMDLMAHGLNVTSAILWRRGAVEAAGGWTEGLGSSQEYDLMFRMLQRSARIVHDDRVLTEIHQRPGASISRSNLDRNWARFVHLRAQIVAHLRSAAPTKDLAPYYQVLFDGLRTLYPYDPATANALYKEYLPPSFRPQRSSATGGFYLLLHRALGFAWANRVRQWLASASTRK